ncbi:MAG: hypothetical protein DMD45_04045 [Gemmatimonadetes bacterium]|nr:MAG: hypothetical protein DMD45_04045 [Gemmatimonadota bacterium]
MIAGAIWGGVAPATAQSALTVAPLVSLAEHRVDAGFGVERSLGPVVGGVGTLRFGPRLAVAVRALGGSLFGSKGVLDRDVGELGVEGSMVAGPWLSLQAGVARRAYATRVARQTWTTVAAGAAARVAFAGGAIHGVGRAALLPVVSVPGLPDPGVAFRAAAGLEYRIRGTTLGVEYSLERYDFPIEGGVRRLEQLTALTLLLRLRPQ